MKSRLEIQGFVDQDDAYLAEVGFWLRLSPAICMVWAAIGTILSSYAVIWSLMPFAALGAILPNHPFDAIYNYGIRYLLKTRPLPRYRAPRRFACGFATVWLFITGLAFYNGAILLGYALGGIMVCMAMIQTLTSFCTPSFIWGLVFGRPLACGR